MRRYAIIAVVLAVLALGADVFRKARLSAIESAQRALVKEAVQLIAEYHQEHGSYPKSLSGLPFTYPDGGGRPVLDLIHYEPQPQGFHLKTTYVSTGVTMSMEHRDEGK